MDNNIKVLRTDNGGELCGKEFDRFYKQCGIARQNTTPYTPYKNGVSKRMNEALVDKERIMLNGVGITQEFWAEEFNTAIYLVNMYPSLEPVDMTPNEVWFGNNPSVSHFKEDNIIQEGSQMYFHWIQIRNKRI
jgi:transposase InsO family protein